MKKEYEFDWHDIKKAELIMAVSFLDSKRNKLINGDNYYNAYDLKNG